MEIPNFKIIDAHMHTYGKFLDPDKNILDYMDRYNVEKAIITTIHRTKYQGSENSVNTENQINNSQLNMFQRFKNILLKGQISHQDVIDIAKRAPDRIYKFFWFNPRIDSPEEVESNYKILEDHFKKGFCGVKIHSAFSQIKVPKDIIDLVTFMQEYDKNLILFIHSLPKTSLFKGITSQDIANLAKKFPNLKIIVGHSAYAMEFAIEVGITLRDYQNLFFETSCSVSFGIYNILKSVGHKRVIFGSDSPTASPLPVEIAKIMTLPKISKQQKIDIFYNNISGILEN